MSNQKDPFFPLPQGEVGAFDANGYTLATQDFRTLNNLADADFVYTPHHGGPGAAGGWRGHQGVGTGYSSLGDTTSAEPRRPPDYGLRIIPVARKR